MIYLRHPPPPFKAPRLDDCHIFFVLPKINNFFSSVRHKARSRATLPSPSSRPPPPHARTRTHTNTPSSRGSMGIDRVGKGALITGPRVREKTAENRSLQLFRAAEQNRLPPVSTARAEPTDGASRHGRPLLCQHFTSSSTSFSKAHTHIHDHSTLFTITALFLD